MLRVPDFEASVGPARVPWVVVLLAGGGVWMPSGQRLLLQRVPAEPEPVNVALTTRFDDAGLTSLLPRELVLEVHLHAEDANTAVAAAGTVGSGLVAIISLAANAFVAPPNPHLAYESAPGLDRRRFWQREVVLQRGLPSPSRTVDQALLVALLKAVFAAAEGDKLSRALSQYHVALGYWTTNGRPLVLAHLYMALEALGPVAEQVERDRLGLASKREHAARRGVDVSRSNWNQVLMGWVRRDVLCKGDRDTYDAARRASDGFEHGSMPLPEYRVLAEDHGRALLDYVRRGLLDLLDLSDDVRSALAAKKPLDVSPLWQEISGELHGAVHNPEQLGEAGQPYPYADWQSTLDDALLLDDGRFQLTPRMTLTMHLADGVLLTVTHHRTGVGLSDPDLFTFEPGTEEPIVTPRARDAATVKPERNQPP